MTQYVVAWSQNGHWNYEDIKVLDDYESAQWFAKKMEMDYNYVRMYEAKDGTAN
tara:strand:- start:1060 stop:1221 length:162 start_codon:yes stop_codon:yes gene_type:complete